jgi:C_GCAxxG_C_C family probable redox protein
MTNSEKAAAVFAEGFNCSQAVLSACGERFALDREVALKVSASFGGGMGRMGETCGAVTGAFMVIGLKQGQTEAKDHKAKEKTYKLVNEFAARFKELNCSIVCRELLGCDVSSPEGLKSAQDKKLFKTICPKFVSDAAKILDQILE